MSKFKKLPFDLTIDMALTLVKLADKFNLNDGQLDRYGLDWWYYHKLVRRAKHYLNENGITFE